MLILPPGHHKQVTERRRLVGLERRLVGGVAVLAAAVLVAVLIGLAGGGASTYKKGCLNVTFASSLGGQDIHQCGPDARATCTALGTPAGYTGDVGTLVAAQCRKLKLPIG